VLERDQVLDSLNSDVLEVLVRSGRKGISRTRIESIGGRCCRFRKNKPEKKVKKKDDEEMKVEVDPEEQMLQDAVE
jgi:hypothetical protein